MDGLQVNSSEPIHFKSPVDGKRISFAALSKYILKLAVKAAGATAAYLFVSDGAYSSLCLESFVLQDRYVQVGVAVPAHCLAGWVFQHRRPVAVDDISCDVRNVIEISLLTGYDARNLLAVPLIANDMCFGILQLADKHDGTLFSAADIENSMSFAMYVSMIYTACRQHAFSAKQRGADIDDMCFVAESSVMREKLEICAYFSQSTVPVLIIGEKGSGKKCFAKQLHKYSYKAQSPLIRINCALHDVELLSAYLFGSMDRMSGIADNCFSAACGGTVFFEEITALPVAFQYRVLDMLKTYAADASSAENKLSVRVIASTSKDIEQLSSSGSFLAELYGCLNVLPVYIPPLRQHPEDIPALARLFLRQCSRETNMCFCGFTADAEKALVQYQWQGNVQELKNTVERGCIMGTPPFVTRKDLFFWQADSSFLSRQNIDMKTAVDFFKRSYILSVLEQNAWNKTAASAVMGIQRTYLSRLIHDLKITRSETVENVSDNTDIL